MDDIKYSNLHEFYHPKWNDRIVTKNLTIVQYEWDWEGLPNAIDFLDWIISQGYIIIKIHEFDDGVNHQAEILLRNPKKLKISKQA